MLVPSLSTLAIGISALYLCTKVKDEVLQLAIALPALFCLLLSIVFAPWLLKLLIAIALLVTKKDTNTLIESHQRVGEGQETTCPFALAPRGIAQKALHALTRLQKGKRAKISMLPCCYPRKKNQATWDLPTTSTPFLLGQPCLHTPSLVCVPLTEVSPK